MNSFLILIGLSVILFAVGIPSAQSENHYPLVFAKFYDVNSSHNYRRRFSVEGPHRDIHITKGGEYFVFIAINVKERDPVTEKVKIADYRTMVLDLVVLDGSDSNGSTKLQFEKLQDAQTLYHSLGEHFQRELLAMKYSVVSIYMTDRSVAKNASIQVQKLSNGKYRFIIIDEDDQPVLIFTSKSFNITTVTADGHVVMSIDTNGYVVTLLIRFSSVGSAHSFSQFANDNDCLNRNINIVAPKMWTKLIQQTAFDS